MRHLLLMALTGGIFLTGCATHHKVKPGAEESPVTSPRASATADKPARPSTALPATFADRLTVTNNGSLVTLTNIVSGKVAKVNAALRFVVLDFSLSPMPAVDQPLDVYRQGKKVGEVKVTGPARNSNIVADMLAGEAQAGDDVRRD